MENKEFAQKLEQRTKAFAISIIKLSLKLGTLAEQKVVKTQLTKSGTAIGANYREANRARSNADFRNKIKICESEASETQYWLDLISDMNWISKKDIILIQNECNELLALFTKIGYNLKIQKIILVT